MRSRCCALRSSGQVQRRSVLERRYLAGDANKRLIACALAAGELRRILGGGAVC
jgi:hypothetical protein